MTGLNNGDITESFFHLSLDHSEQFSSSDDISVHGSEEILNFLRLARAHDENTRRGYTGDDFSEAFSGENPGFTRDSGYRNPHLIDGATQRRENAFKRHVSDSVLVLGNSQSIPFAHGRKFPGKNGKNGENMHPRGHFHEHVSQNSTFDYNSAGLNGDPTILRNELTGIRGIDVESLFKAFQPLLDQYFNQKNASHSIHSNTVSGPKNIMESDPDSAVDDTFDRPKRTAARLARPELSSPVTSPPQSSGDSQFCFDKSTEVEDSEVCQPIERKPQPQPQQKAQPQTKAQPQKPRPRGQKEVIRRAPQIDLGNLTADEIDLDLELQTDDDNTEKRAEVAKKDALEEMQAKLEQYKKDNDGLLNEIEFLRCKLAAISVGVQQPTHETTQNELKGSENSLTKADCEDLPESFEANLPEQFRPYYERLKLHKVDELSDSEKSYLIKNLMLLLLVSDFDHLSVMMPKVGIYLLKTTAFLDAVHEHFYPDQEMKPLQYLCNYKLDINSGFQQCLDGMLKQICENTDE